MSYNKGAPEKKYREPQASTGLKGKHAFSGKKDYEKDLISRSSEKAARESE